MFAYLVYRFGVMSRLEAEHHGITRPHPGGRRGRGSLSNASSRFEPEIRVRQDDGWGALDEVSLPLRTTVTFDATRRIIARNASPDIPFNQSINPYRGCEHGCIYCYARPSHAYLGLSPGLDFESRLFAKPNAAKLLEAELREPHYRCEVMALGTNTDPYQPIERGHRITRGILEVLAAFDHPVGIVTKSALVQRDIDILAGLAEKNLAKVVISVTTLDRKLARAMEPRAATPGRRLDTIHALAKAGIPVGVMVAPVIPGLTDWEIERILYAAAEAGAKEAGFTLLRLPHEIKHLFREWLVEREPLKAKRVIQLVRETRGGRLNDPNFASRMRGEGPIADLIRHRFRLACTRFGLNRRNLRLDCSRFRRPPARGDQLGLF